LHTPRKRYELGQIDHHEYISILEHRIDLRDKRIDRLKKQLRETTEDVPTAHGKTYLDKEKYRKQFNRTKRQLAKVLKDRAENFENALSSLSAAKVKVAHAQTIITLMKELG